MRSTLVSWVAKLSMKSYAIPAPKPSLMCTLCEVAVLARFSRVVGESNAVQSYKLNQRAGHKCFTGKSTKTEK